MAVSIGKCHAGPSIVVDGPGAVTDRGLIDCALRKKIYTNESSSWAVTDVAVNVVGIMASRRLGDNNQGVTIRIQRAWLYEGIRVFQGAKTPPIQAQYHERLTSTIKTTREKLEETSMASP